MRTFEIKLLAVREPRRKKIVHNHKTDFPAKGGLIAEEPEKFRQERTLILHHVLQDIREVWRSKGG